MHFAFHDPRYANNPLERARGAGMRLAEWLREALLAAPVEPAASSGVDSGEVALGEVPALGWLLLNLHFRAAKGEPVAEAEMRGLIERADHLLQNFHGSGG